MTWAGHKTRLRRSALLATAGVALLAPAAWASARSPSLKITVPAKVHDGENYQTKIRGTFDTRSAHRTAYLWAFIQYSADPCQATAQAEEKLPSSLISSYFTAGRKKAPTGFAEAGSPFVRTDSWRAGNTYGVRHVCAYLYGSRITQASSARPIARADATYRDV
jgi:hypothetical protein